MENKVNWKYLGCSIAFSLFFGYLYTLLLVKPNGSESWIREMIMHTLSFSAIPGLFIACMVILSVKDVRDELNKINEYVSVVNDFKNDAKKYFFQNYNTENGFSNSVSLLNKDLELYIQDKVGGNSDEVLKRVITESRTCMIYIQQFKYVDANLTNFESRKSTYQAHNKENLSEDKVYLAFNSKDKEELTNLLTQIYEKREILNITKLDKLVKLLNSYDTVCRTLDEKIRLEVQSFAPASAESTKEEIRIDE